MHPSNEILRSDLYIERSYESLVRSIEENLEYYSKLASACAGIEVRSLRHGIPHFSLTKTDQCAVLVQYLSAAPWGGPLWRCTTGSTLYASATSEFEELWKLGALEQEG